MLTRSEHQVVVLFAPDGELVSVEVEALRSSALFVDNYPEHRGPFAVAAILPQAPVGGLLGLCPCALVDPSTKTRLRRPGRLRGRRALPGWVGRPRARRQPLSRRP